MRYLSVCSGIEAATRAWHPMGWESVAFSEIEAFPSAVLAHHYPDTPNWGDMTKFQEWPDAKINVLVGGTPCQSFSVAGLRKGLADPRGNLALTYLAIADKYRPAWLVWENVPGVLSADGGRAFGAILGGMGKLGYGFAYRVLDAQFVRTREFPGAVPQRRRRVFVVAHLGDWRRAAAVLFDVESLSGNPAPRREAGEGAAHSVAPCIGASGRGFERAGETRGQDPVVACDWPPEVAPTLNAHFGDKHGLEDQHALSGAGLFTATSFHNRQDPDVSGDVTHPLGSMDNGMAVAIRPDATPKWQNDVSFTLTTPSPSGGGHPQAVQVPSMAVRRLTPIECERLQGFPDNFTRIPWRGKPAERCPDGPRYKALGNSMAVNCMEWLGERIQMVEGLS